MRQKSEDKRVFFNPDTLLIFVDVYLDNDGPFTFIIDTGAMASLISKSLAYRFMEKSTEVFQGYALGFGESEKPETDESPKLTRINFNKIRIGELEHKGFKPFVMDLSHISRAIGSDIAGVIGFDVLSAYKVSINYKSGEIIFSALPNEPETTGTDFELFLNHIYVPVIIDDKEFFFLLDTGASHCVLSKMLVDSLGLMKKLHPARVDTLIGASGSASEVPTFFLDSLTVSSKTTVNVEVAIVDLSTFSSILGREIYGVIGHNFLKNFELVLNYRDMKLFLR